MQKNIKEKYIICEEIGSGGSGKVYKVYDKHLQCYMAMKEFRKEEGVALKELDMMKLLRHPALPVITDYIDEGEYKYLVMEYIEGWNLETYIGENGAIAQEKAVKWAIELADVLIFLHERVQPVIYRDMKPANIMLDCEQNIHLVDFGASYVRYDEGQEKYIGAGTVGYSAPEQFDVRGGEAVDERSDIYGLGTTLFHMLTGANPAAPPYLMLPVRAYNRGLSSELEKIVKRATETDKNKRYRTVRQLREALEKYKSADRIKERIKTGGNIFYYLLLVSAGIYFFYTYVMTEHKLSAADNIIQGKILWGACIVFVICFGRSAADRYRKRGWRGIRQMRSLLLTTKKGKGLTVLAIVGIAALFAAGESVLAKENSILKVEVRNEYGQKILIHYDAVYPLKDTLKLELPISNFQEGVKYELRLECVNCDTEEKCSRTFYLKGVEP